MKKLLVIIVKQVVFIGLTFSQTTQTDLKLWYTKPAELYEMVDWTVSYKPGNLQSIGYKGGKEVSRFTVETTDEPVSLQLLPDRSALAGDGFDAMPVTVQALDAQGRPVPTANIPVEFALSGFGAIIGFGNGNPNSHESEKGNRRKLFNGLAQVILQSSFNGNGTLILKARSTGLKPAEVAIQINHVPQIPFVEVVHPQLVLNKWRVSTPFVGRPDAKVEPEKTDMNSWANIKPGTLQEMRENGFLVFKTTFKPYNTQQKSGGIPVLKSNSGKAEIWLDSEKVATKNSSEKEDLTVKFPAKEGERKLTVIVEGSKGGKIGLGGTVAVETND